MGEVTVLDASVLINLQCCGHPERVFAAIPGRRLVPNVTSGEVIKQPLDRLISSRLIELTSLLPPATETFMKLVGADPPDDLGDGEAAAIALAHQLGATIALDEKKARRIVREQFTSLAVISTVDIFALPSVTAALGTGLADAVYAALVNSRMRVLPEQLDWVLKLLGPRAADCPSLKRHLLTTPRGR
jgi:predicted nucleic acid-binding protein